MEIQMSNRKPSKPQRTHVEEPDDSEPGMLPVDPDEGPIAPVVPGDAEHDHGVDPEA
jgi:hypothetical protein